MPGWLVTSEGKLTVALDITVTPALLREGVARELINRIQNIRKDSGLEVTDKISVAIEAKESVKDAVAEFGGYIGSRRSPPKSAPRTSRKANSRSIRM